MALIQIRARKLVGVFYSSPEPGKSPYVSEGDSIESGVTLCIIDMMKSMLPMTWRPDIVKVADVVWKDDGLPFDPKKIGNAIIRKVCPTNESSVNEGDVLFELEVGDKEVTAVVTRKSVTLPTPSFDSDVTGEVVSAIQQKEHFKIHCNWVGWYFLSPSDSTKPYVQIGDVVEKGTVLCRIRTRELPREETKSRRARILSRLTARFRHLPIRDHLVTTPIKGIVRERCAEDERISKERLTWLGSQEFTVLRDAFPVEYGEVLFVLEPID